MVQKLRIYFFERVTGLFYSSPILQSRNECDEIMQTRHFSVCYNFDVSEILREIIVCTNSMFCIDKAATIYR